MLVGPPTFLHFEGPEGALQLPHLPAELGRVRRAVVPRRRRRRRRRRHCQLGGEGEGGEEVEVEVVEVEVVVAVAAARLT